MSYPEYKMTHLSRGAAMIFNQTDFDPSTKLDQRKSSDRDAMSMYEALEHLSFDVAIHNNKTANEMLQLIKKAASLDNSECDALVICILSHGGDGYVYARDKIVHLENIASILKDSKTLHGKPKLFFIQACQGEKFDEGVIVGEQADAALDSDSDGEPDELVKIPKESDFLYYYSTVRGYYSWRNSNTGSFFIKTLSKHLLKRDVFSSEICSILTQVTAEVSEGFESKTAEAALSGLKQSPIFYSTLRKALYFKKKTSRAMEH